MGCSGSGCDHNGGTGTDDGDKWGAVLVAVVLVISRNNSLPTLI